MDLVFADLAGAVGAVQPCRAAHRSGAQFADGSARARCRSCEERVVFRLPWHGHRCPWSGSRRLCHRHGACRRGAIPRGIAADRGRGALLAAVRSPCLGPALGDANALALAFARARARAGAALKRAAAIMAACAPGVSSLILAAAHGLRGWLRRNIGRMLPRLSPARPVPEWVITELMANNRASGCKLPFLVIDWGQPGDGERSRWQNRPRRSTPAALKGRDKSAHIVAATDKARIRAVFNAARAAAG